MLGSFGLLEFRKWLFDFNFFEVFQIFSFCINGIARMRNQKIQPCNVAHFRLLVFAQKHAAIHNANFKVRSIGQWTKGEHKWLAFMSNAFVNWRVFHVFGIIKIVIHRK